MISRERTEPAIAAGVEEWHRGREADPTLAPRGVPDLSVVPGYSLDDVRYNCVGLQSPAQSRDVKKTLLLQLVGMALGVAYLVLTLAQGGNLGTLLALIVVGAGLGKTVIYFEEIRAGDVRQVDGDIWTEMQRDSESSDESFVHINDLKLKITKQAYAALRAGGPYRIYYLPGPKRAVGGQVLPAWRPLPQPTSKPSSGWRSSISIEG